MSAALSGATSPARVHKAAKRTNVAPSSTAGRPAPLAKSKSPAAKSRQRQIERDNLVLINKLLALDNRTRKPKAGVKPRPLSAHPTTSRCVHQDESDVGDDLIDVQAALTARDHACAPIPAAPQSAASHALYTRRSAGAHNGFCEQNAPVLDRQAGAARRRSSAQRRILDENKKLLERILTTRTTVSRADWQRHEQEHRRLLGNISRHGLRHPTESPQEHELLTRSRSSAILLSGRDDVVAIGGDNTDLDTSSRSNCRRRSRPLAASSSMPVLPVHSARPSDSVVQRMRRMVIEADDQ